MQNAGDNAGFLTLAAIATVALAVFWFFMPATKAGKTATRSAAAAT